MASNAFSQLPKFREAFKKKIEQKITSWYPGHMFKEIKAIVDNEYPCKCYDSSWKVLEVARFIDEVYYPQELLIKKLDPPDDVNARMLQMQAKLATVDCIIEVHDARVPFSGRNPLFQTMLTAIRPHMMVFNKMDLSDLAYKSAITKQLQQQEQLQNVLFTNCKQSTEGDVNKIVPLAIDLIRNSEHFNSAFKDEYKIMVIGIPNVGKSSLINRLRHIHLGKKKATIVGAIPGVTKSVLERIRISDDPLIYLLDTPGVMQPNIKNLEVGLRLALCSTLSDTLVGEQLIADYLLYWLNKHQNFSYVEYLGIPKPVDDIRLLLFQTCRILNLTLKIKNTQGSYVIIPNLQAGAAHFLKGFRKGTFGKVMLDDDIINVDKSNQ